MQGVLDLPPDLAPVGECVGAHLDRVARRFDEQLDSDLPPVSQLVAHVERYRGKMLRPSLVILCGLASAGTAPRDLGEAHVLAAGVCEMVHMATLVHDDVLDEADLRRAGATINRLRGNESAVILGDYLLASAYHLCCQIAPAAAAQSAALAVGRASMVTCSGELLQLHHRADFSLDEPTYFEIIERKTAELIATSCELGAMLAGAPEETVAALSRFGRRLGAAFQIQDDLLDLTGSERSVGKSVHKDAEKGKLTLPIIHHLANASPARRAATLLLLERAGRGREPAASRELLEAPASTGSTEHAAGVARGLVERSKQELRVGEVVSRPAGRVLSLMADAVVERTR